jgi:hypothetical protein
MAIQDNVLDNATEYAQPQATRYALPHTEADNSEYTAKIP